MLRIQLQSRTQQLTGGKLQFVRQEFADISTDYLPSNDLDILMNPKTPLHIATMAGGTGAIFLVPETPELLNSMMKTAREVGLSNTFVEIIRDLSAQGVYYAVFDREGCNVSGLKKVSSN